MARRCTSFGNCSSVPLKGSGLVEVLHRRGMVFLDDVEKEFCRTASVTTISWGEPFSGLPCSLLLVSV